MIFLKRLYLIFIILPLAVLFALYIMLIAFIEHIINKSKIKYEVKTDNNMNRTNNILIET